MNSKGKKFLYRNNDELENLSSFKYTYANIYGSININTLEDLSEQVKKCYKELMDEPYLGHLKQTMFNIFKDCFEMKDQQRFNKIVCFGLGNFTESISSLYQLVLLLLMRQELNYCSDIEIYDPCFTHLELKSLKASILNLIPLDCNTQCRYPLNDDTNGQTLFFMPHMYANSFNNLVESNWNHLNKVTIYSNSFQHLFDFVNLEKHEYLTKLKNKQHYNVLEFEVPNEFHFRDIFNSLSIHVFTKI
ncbi:hypothetical protein BLOT_002821 [Blomia tropicalis]|nr:hypothetical protein BLOT_002821 [Blomia tropicalis]